MLLKNKLLQNKLLFRKNMQHALMLYVLLFPSFGDSQIGNYVFNGSFELKYNCNPPYTLNKAIGWCNIGSDTTALAGGLYSINCFSNAPNTDAGFQYPHSGKTFGRTTPFCINPCPFYASRGYPKNRLKASLVSNKTYCVKMYVNLENVSPYAISNIGFYFGDNYSDTMKYGNGPITYLNPQVKNPVGNIITDTLNWVPITGTFVANGSEKYLVIGNFESNASTTKTLVSSDSTYVWSEYFIDDVSCIELNLPAYAGPDKLFISGDSVYIGRERDFEVDKGCTWYKLPNMITAIDTASGLWVKPVVTTTYVVKQVLDCSSLKWDTVVIYMNPLGIVNLSAVENNIKLFPNPVNENLELRINNEELIKDFKTLSIYNNLGQMIKEQDFIFENKKVIVKTVDLSNGVYLLQLKSENSETVYKRFVISR
jgi:hypothetical protein